MNLSFNNKIKIITDFNSKLTMFKLKEERLTFLKNFKNIEIEYLNPKKLRKTYYGDIYWGTKLNDNLLKKIKNLKWIHHGSVGIDHLDIKYIFKKGIILTISKNINSETMSNLAIEYILDTSKKLFFLKNNSSREQYEDLFNNCKDLNNQKICILGYGNISNLIKLKLSNFDLDVTFFTNRNINKANFLRYNKFKQKISNFDTIINILDGKKKNNKFLNSKCFKKMKKDVNLIILGRYSTVDLKSLYAFLKKNTHSHCYLDANPNRPLNQIFVKLKKLKNLYVSPHIGGYFKEYWNDQILIFEKNLRLFIKNKKLINEVKFK